MSLSLSSSENEQAETETDTESEQRSESALGHGSGHGSGHKSGHGFGSSVGLSASEPSVVFGFQRLTVAREPERPTNSVRQILRELRELNKENFDNHQLQVRVKGDDPRHLLVTLTPDDGLYVDGHYEISMTLPDNYPQGKPTFHCDSPIFHPNIAYDGGICFSLLEENESFLRIGDYAHGLLWLMYYPNLYSRVNMDCPRDEKLFREMVRTSIEGGVVAGRVYERSVRLGKKEEEKMEEGKSGLESGCVGGSGSGVGGEKSGKKWEWRLVNKEWVQVFIEECQSANATSCD